MVLFLRSKTLDPGPADFDNKNLLLSNNCAVYMLPRNNFDRMPPSESHKRSQGGQFTCTTLRRKRENKEKYNKASKHTNV